MDWNKLAAISSLTYTILFGGSILVIWEQLRGLRRATYAQSFAEALARMQSEDIREARARVFGLKDKPFLSWVKEDIEVAEKVCHTYDSVGIMVRNALLPKDMIVDHWSASLRRLWPILQPLVDKYRQERDAPELWDDFEFLYLESIKRQKRSSKSSKRQSELGDNAHKATQPSPKSKAAKSGR